jgi:hypothetical protein
MKTNFEKVKEEVQTAYADAFSVTDAEYDRNFSRRKLEFKASEPVTVREAKRIFQTVKRFTYNEFRPSCLNHLDPYLLVTIGREYSVVLYVHTPKLSEELKSKLKCDGFHAREDGTFRLFWD